MSTDAETLNKAITQIAKATKARAFIQPADDITDADALGIAIANWAEWDGDIIADAFFSALEDANYSRDRADFILLWNDRNGTKFH